MVLKLKKVERNTFAATDGYALDHSALEPGDRVALVHQRLMDPDEVYMFIMDRRTKTQIICIREGAHAPVRFREDGSLVGDSHYTVLRAPFDPLVLDALEAIRLADHARKVEGLLKSPATDHDTRSNLLASIAHDTLQAQEDLITIRSAVTEWHAAVADV